MFYPQLLVRNIPHTLQSIPLTEQKEDMLLGLLTCPELATLSPQPANVH
jgi:hypothetical protein